jgi:hypothetical protein
MADKTLATPRQPNGFGALVTRLLETLGLLNKGSAESAATPTSGEAAQTTGVSNNALNVTRVGGLAALITGAGAAAIGLFHVNVKTDPASVVVAAYGSVGAIVAAALLTAAIIVSADIRARTALNAQAAAPAPPAPQATDADSFGNAWYRALSMLHAAVDKLDLTDDSDREAWLQGSTAAKLTAAASTGLTEALHPSAGAQATQHQLLKTGQSSVVSLLEGATNPTGKANVVSQARAALGSMDTSLPWPG